MKANILIVDPSVNTTHRLKKLIEDKCEGVMVISASNSREALTQLHKTHEIIMLDINLGADDGFQLIQKINELDSSPTIIIITSSNTRKSFVKGIRLGATDYILKPFENDYIIKKIKKHITRSQQTDIPNMESSIYKHVETAIKNKNELLIGLIVVYNVNNPTQVISNIPIIRGLFSKYSMLTESNSNNLQGIEYSGETGRHGANGILIILDRISRADKEFVVADFKNISNQILTGTDYAYELEFMSIPYELRPNEKILDTLTRKIEENIDFEKE